jgi:tetratricopeptide (TPR) repeat protein
MRLNHHLPLALVALSACSSTPEEVSGPSVSKLIQLTRYEDALRLSQELVTAAPRLDNYEQYKQRDTATIAWLLNQGRTQTFDDKDYEALTTFEQALLLRPDSEIVLKWIGKTRAKIANRLFHEGTELHALEEYDQAIVKYDEALQMAPDFDSVIRAKGLATRQSQYRVDLAKGYYVAGVRALSDYWLEQAKSRFGYTRKYLPEHSRALNRRIKVDGMLAGQRLILGNDYMSRGLYAAARNEFRLALILHPATEGLQERLDEAAREAAAGDQLLKAEMLVFKSEFDGALAALDEGIVLTTMQAEQFELVRMEIDEEKNRIIYERALAYEHDYLYEEAIKVYDELLARTDYHEDSRARRETLKDYVKNADRLYEEISSAGESRDKLSLLRQIEIFWPEYRDIQERILRLEHSLNS